MNDREDDLELQALQRELDDAFATTRPRRGYEDELWLLIQKERPVANHLRDSLAAFWQSIRTAPAAPAAAVASILVVALGVGIFAAALGAALVDRPDGYLGNYSATTYSLRVRGTVQSPPTSPAYFILANLSMPDVQVAGATAEDLANIFLAEHSLLPQWPYKVSVDASADPIKVHYERQFTVPGYGPAHLVDSSGVRYGMGVHISGKRPTLVSGPLPVNLETSYYRIVSPGQAFSASPSASASASR